MTAPAINPAVTDCRIAADGGTERLCCGEWRSHPAAVAHWQAVHLPHIVPLDSPQAPEGERVPIWPTKR